MLFLSLTPCRVWWNQQWNISKWFYEPQAKLDQGVLMESELHQKDRS